MDSTSGSTVVSVKPAASRRRTVLSGLALVLACLTILVTTVAVWTHQVVLNTDRFTALVTEVVAEPAIIDPLSARISTQVVAALDVEARIAARLPDAAKPLAGALAVAVRDAIDKRLQVVLANPKAQAALVRTMSFAHGQIVNLLRDRADAVTVVDGYVQIAVFPVVGAALEELQAIGLIPPEVQLPDLTSPDAPDVLAQRLESALGITLPPDFGTIQLMPADRLLTARTVVRAFDLIVIALVILSVLLVALALWLAQRRRRMVIYLALGTIIAFLLARMAIGTLEDTMIAGIADEGISVAVRAMVDATVADFRNLTILILIATVIVAVLAYFWGRPTWAVQAASMAGGAAGRAGAAAGAAGAAGISAAGDAAPTRQALGESVDRHRSSVRQIGFAAIAFIVVWLAIGLEIALLGLALVVGFELVLRAVASSHDGEVSSDPADDAPTTET